MTATELAKLSLGDMLQALLTEGSSALFTGGEVQGHKFRVAVVLERPGTSGIVSTLDALHEHVKANQRRVSILDGLPFGGARG